MKRRLLTALAAVSIAMSIAPAVAPAAVTFAASNGECDDATQQNLHTGMTVQHGTTDRDGILARIDPSSAMKDCIGPDIVGAASAWVAFTGPDVNAILQIGVIRCHDPLFGACDGTFHYFWARGGCGLNLPDVKDLGPADEFTHQYRIYSSGTNWVLSRDDDLGSQSRHYYIAKNNDAIGCWANGYNFNLNWHGERRDSGDGLGRDFTLPTEFRSMQTHWRGESTWRNTSFSSGGCTYADALNGHTSQCAVEGQIMQMGTTY